MLRATLHQAARPCLTDRQLLARAEGCLAPTALREVEDHLDDCPACLELLAALISSTEADARRTEAAVSDTIQVRPGPLLADGRHRYLPGPEIAHGGMGRILAAEDRLLGRPVALKLLRRSSARLVRRFLRERRLTARLQHPAIVPVHDVGELDDGEPFFVMRLVKGERLDISAERARSLEERLQFLPAVLGVVDAVAYAHGEGVIHRDLKPQNVLVGPFGEVVVLDWGLARELGAEADPDLEHGDTQPGAPDNDMMTRDGERLGTLAYMAPEQAAGRLADTRSDVYGLGAILYHVLSGSPPHTGRSASLSAGAVHHAPPPLAGHVPDAPADLVAIVARAMAPDPAARYASAQELASDLKRWQAGRLVQAHRYSPGERLRRFMYRFRAPLLVGAAALVALLALGAVSLQRILAERRRALAEQTLAQQARTRAETQQLAAEQLVGFILGDLRPRLERIGRLDALAGVARAVIAYQDSSPPTEDAHAWLRRADAAGLAGDVAFESGDLAAADESYRRSRTAANEAGDIEGAALARCSAANRLGNVHRRRGEYDEAVADFAECNALARDATSPALREQLLRSRFGLAETSRLRGDVASARERFEEGLAEATTLVDEAGGPAADTAKLLVQFHAGLWQTLTNLGELRAAREVALKLVTLARARADAHPNDVGARFDLAAGQTALGTTETRLGDSATAERLIQESLAAHRVLVAMDPSNVRWQRSLGFAAASLADLLLARSETAAALPLAQLYTEASGRSAAASPEDQPMRWNLAGAHVNEGQILVALGRLDAARQTFQQARDIVEDMFRASPGDPRIGFLLGTTLGEMGSIDLKAHRIAVGQALLQRSIGLLRARLAATDVPDSRTELAKYLVILAKSERGPARRANVDEAATALEPLRGLLVDDAELRALLHEVEQLQRK